MKLESLGRRSFLESIWRAGVARVHGGQAMSYALDQLPDFSPSHMVAVGKAAGEMAGPVLRRGGPDMQGLVVCKEGIAESGPGARPGLQVLRGGHPVPDEGSLAAGLQLRRFMKNLKEQASLAMLVSGGASALVEDPIEGVSLSDLQGLNRSLLADGSDIGVINQQRKALSRIKAGRLLKGLGIRELRVFALSDVPDGDLSVIGSGIGDPVHAAAEKTTSMVVGSNAMAREAAADQARNLGAVVQENSEDLYGDLLQVADHVGNLLRHGPPGIYIFGGEPTVVLPDCPGEGGRNQALAVALAQRLAGMVGISVLAGGTDGNDGPGTSAGGFVTSECWNRVGGGQRALREANTGAWLRRSGGLFVSGPTGTNVMDLLIAEKAGPM